MNSFNKASTQIRLLDAAAAESRWINRIHPLVKLVVTVFYIAVTVSFNKYDLTGLLGMLVYLIFIYGFCDLSAAEAFYRLRIILPIVCVVGLFNPFFDREIITYIGGIAVSGGVISMITLMMKGVFSVLATYALIATTGIEKLCFALRLIHVPKILVTQILLIYRYISVLLSEADRMTQAYALRAPGQKGIHFKVWGPLAGQLLLRSMDRAENVYESMCLRGYTGEFYYGGGKKACTADYVYLVLWLALTAVFRIFPVFEIIGSLFV